MNELDQTTHFIQHAAEYFDQLVPVATDDELFAAGYLRGHVDLVVGTLQVSEQPFDVEQITSNVAASLQQAIMQGELNAADEQQVRAVWQQLLHLYETSAPW